MEKKISFGFSKVAKKNIFVNKLIPKEDNKVDLIKCLEGQSIQLVEENVEEAPLVIPLKDSRKTSAALLSLKTRQAVLNGEDIPAQEEILKPPAEHKIEDAPNGKQGDDIEKRAARELLAEINKADVEDGNDSNLVLPIKAEDLPLDGAKESTIDDYDSIPIQQFGLAMLRGMGWKDQPKKKGALVDEGPILRPKGMGLGADKAIKAKALLVAPEANEILEIKKGACIRVLGGKHKDLYGLVEGLDDHAGRVIVKMALGNTKESFNEFMVQPVSKKEYAQYSKCINSAKYDEYKKKENEMGQIIIKKDDKIKEEDKDTNKPESSHSKHRNNDDDRKHERYKVSSRRNSSESENNPRKTERRSRSREKHSEDFSRSSTSHKKYSSGRTHSRNRSKSYDSKSSNSSTYRKKHKKKSSKSKKSKKSKDKNRERRHSTQSSTDDERRHKKKTKKSKRGRSRSRSKGRR